MRNPLTSANNTRRLFLALLLTVAGTMVAPTLGLAQTQGMDRRDDRGERLQERDDKWVERRNDPIGVRGPERREDRRDLQNDRQTDRRERIY